MITGEIQTWDSAGRVKGRITGVIASDGGEWVTIRLIGEQPDSNGYGNGDMIAVRKADLTLVTEVPA